MVTDPTGDSPEGNQPSEGTHDTPKNYAITLRVFLEIVHGDTLAREIFLHGDEVGINFYAPEAVTAKLKEYLNALISDKKASFFYARHLYRILVEHAGSPDCGESSRPRTNHPLRIVSWSTYQSFLKKAKSMMPKGKEPDIDSLAVALSKGKGVNLWVGDGSVKPLPVGASVASVTTENLGSGWDSRANAAKLATELLEGLGEQKMAAVGLITARQNKIKKILNTVSQPSTLSLEKSTMGAGMATFTQYAVGLREIHEPTEFIPKSVIWALEHVGFFTGKDFMTPVFLGEETEDGIFLGDLPKPDKLTDVTYFTFFKARKDAPGVQYEEVHMLHMIKSWSDLFIQKENIPGQEDLDFKIDYGLASGIWYTSKQPITTDLGEVPGLETHALYWQQPQAGPKTSDHASSPPFTPDAVTRGASDPDRTRDAFYTGDLITEALNARADAEKDFYASYQISYDQFSQRHPGFKINLEVVREGNLFLKVTYIDGKGNPDIKYYQLVESDHYIRRVDPVYGQKYRIARMNRDPTMSAGAKQSGVSKLLSIIQNSRDKNNQDRL